ncbi:MAG: DUF4340 domain-containing protein [Rickettsiales bacterium]
MASNKKCACWNTKIVACGVMAFALIAGAVYLSKKESPGAYDDAKPKLTQFFTDFKPLINKVARISMRSKGRDFVIEKIEDGEWVMPDRFSYPVEAEKVRSILLNAAELEILEKKTDDPAKLEKIGLGDPDSKDSDAVRVTFFDDKGGILTNFIAGKRRLNGGYSLYVRKENENQAYLVKGDGWMRLELGPNYWLGAERFFLEKDEIKRVDIVHEGGEEIAFEREHADARKFRVETLPDGKEDDPAAVNETAFAPADLRLSGVIKASEMKKSHSPGKTAVTYRTFGGLEVAYDLEKDADGDYMASISANVAEGSSDSVASRAKIINEAAKPWRYVVDPETAKLLTRRPFDFEKKPKQDEAAKENEPKDLAPEKSR